MHGSRAENVRLVSGIIDGLTSHVVTADVLVCPTYVYLAQIADLIAETPIQLGAQDVATEDSGAYTGEVAGQMLKDVGCTYTIVGHSERRALFGDSDATVAAKFNSAQRAGLMPVLCVGETLEQREAEETVQVIRRQLEAVLDVNGSEALKNSVVAYEPVWAIGTGKTASPAQAQEIHGEIRALLATRDAKMAADLRILYGGSVKPENAAELFAMADIDGGLIGGASLRPDSFLQICSAAE